MAPTRRTGHEEDGAHHPQNKGNALWQNGKHQTQKNQKNPPIIAQVKMNLKEADGQIYNKKYYIGRYRWPPPAHKREEAQGVENELRGSGNKPES
ncbi:MAG TPA: hypothetical protein VK737_08530 [Opitutales bacterium]|nr:hypothetical protein [Opitutales bacterium]